MQSVTLDPHANSRLGIRDDIRSCDRIRDGDGIRDRHRDRIRVGKRTRERVGERRRVELRQDALVSAGGPRVYERRRLRDDDRRARRLAPAHLRVLRRLPQPCGQRDVEGGVRRGVQIEPAPAMSAARLRDAHRARHVCRK